MIKNRHITKIASAFIARWKSLLGITGILLLSLLVVSCADAGDDDTDTDDDTFAVGGTVSGLAESEEITLTLTPTNGTAEEKKVTGNADATTDDNFTFDTKLAKDAKYTITSTSPAGKLCTVEPAGEQTMGEGDVTTVKVTCVTETPVIQTFSIGGTISGHTDTVDLNLAYGSESENLPIAVGATEFTFAKKLELSDTYTVSVATEPAGQTCIVSPDTEQTMLGDVTDISVTCEANTYTVGGVIIGLAEDQPITLTLTTTGGTTENKQFNGDSDTNFGDPYAFDTLVAAGATYEVTVATSPSGKTCIVVLGGEKTMPDEIVLNMSVVCSDISTYSVGGSVSGLAENDEVILTLTPTGGTAEDETVTGDATATTDDDFTFDTKLAKDATYTVSVKTQPTGKTCTVDPATEQTMGEADVTTVKVTCVVAAAATYSVGGSVSGLAENDEVILTLTPTGGTAEDETVTGDATATTDDDFTFDTKLAKDATYTVSVKTQPTGKTCTVDPATEQTMGEADVTTVKVTCVVAAAATYSVGGEIRGLPTGGTITLTLTPTGGDVEEIVITGTADFSSFDYYTFATKLANGTIYEVAVTVPPSGMNCIFQSQVDDTPLTMPLTMGDADVTIIAITCQ